MLEKFVKLSISVQRQLAVMSDGWKNRISDYDVMP